MIYIFTGSPGSGKTLSAIEFIESVQKEMPGRIIYSANIEGMCMPGVLPLDDDGIRRWHEVCEPNSLIVVDEAQRYWRAQRSGEPSQAIIELETHRHDGIDIVMMTQHPTFLHANIRKLANVHVHLVAYTKQSALRWEWREVHDDVQDNALRAAGEFKEWHYPVRLYQHYKSATQHTKRAKRPFRQTLGRIGLVAVGLVFLGMAVIGGRMMYRGVTGAKEGFSHKSSAHTPEPVTRNAARSSASGRPDHVLTAAEYAAQQIPRIAAQPWSAPIYDGQAVTQHPRVFCIAPAEPVPGCKCITDQGTHYEADETLCRKLALEGGTYDPYLPERTDEAPPSAAPVVAGAPTLAAAALPLGIPGPKPAGVGAQKYEPPGYGAWNPDALSGSASHK